MRTVSFAELYKLDYSITNILAIHQYWADNATFTTPKMGRSENGLMFLVNCEVDYFIREQNPFSARLGDIAYVPAGSNYTCKFKNCAPSSEGPSTILINFTLYDEHGNEFRLGDGAFVITPKNSYYYQTCFLEILALDIKGDAPPARKKAFLYNLLTDLSLELRKEISIPKRFAPIYKGIVYIENNYSSDLSVPMLAELCHVSEATFRRLFKQYTGKSPWEYILDLRIAKARLYLNSGMVTVSQAAELVGFDDPAYFSRLFKKKTGTSPSAILGFQVRS